MPIKSYKNQNYLQHKLENLSSVKFSYKTIDLLNTEGYYRTNMVISFMKDHNLKTENRIIQMLYRREKHLRHMIMPKIETFEHQLSYAILSITSKKTQGQNIFNETHNLFIKKSIVDMREKIKSGLTRSLKTTINFNSISVFDYFPYLSLGNLIHIYKSLKPKWKKEVLDKAFKIKVENIELPSISQHLLIILKLRNSIAHGSQLLKKKGMSIAPFLKNGSEAYTIGLESFMKECKFKELSLGTKSHITFFNNFLKNSKND